MRLAVENINLNIEQYEYPHFEGNKDVILSILNRTVTLLQEDRDEGEISHSYYYNSLKKIIAFIERNNITESKFICYPNIKKELDKLTAPIAVNEVNNAERP